MSNPGSGSVAYKHEIKIPPPIPPRPKQPLTLLGGMPLDSIPRDKPTLVPRSKTRSLRASGTKASEECKTSVQTRDSAASHPSQYLDDLKTIDFDSTIVPNKNLNGVKRSGLSNSEDNLSSMVSSCSMYPDIRGLFTDAIARDPSAVNHYMNRPLPQPPKVEIRKSDPLYNYAPQVNNLNEHGSQFIRNISNPNYIIGFDAVIQGIDLNAAPYQIPRPQSLHELSSVMNTDHQGVVTPVISAQSNNTQTKFSAPPSKSINKNIRNSSPIPTMSAEDELIDFLGDNNNVEGEYLSLDDFDPLYKKPSQSFENTYLSPNAIIPASPESYEDVPIYEELTGESEGAMSSQQATQVSEAAYTVPVRPPRAGLKQDVDKNTYESLRPVTFMDKESQSFCDMVTRLKLKYLSVEENHNQGYILSPQIGYMQHELTSVKVSVHVHNSVEPIVFTCDVDILVEHVISQVLCSREDNLNPSLSTDDYVLKLYDRSEYFNNNMYVYSKVPLSWYAYIHHCLKVDSDIRLTMVSRQHMTFPLLRTVDDDTQPVYFPRDFVQKDPGEVSKESLDILMDTFYSEIEKLRDQTLQGKTEVNQCRCLIQSVKAVCAILAKIETMAITKAVAGIESIIQQLSGKASFRLDGEYDIQNDSQNTPPQFAATCSLVEVLQVALEDLMVSVQDLVTLYCRTFQLDFTLQTATLTNNEHRERKDVTSIQDHFLVHIASAHRLSPVSMKLYEGYYVTCSLHLGTSQLGDCVHTGCIPLHKRGLCERVLWDEWLLMPDLTMVVLPRESRLCLTLYAKKTVPSANITKDSSSPIHAVLGGATIPLFDHNGDLVQGSQLVILEPGRSADPLGPRLTSLLPDSVLLQINLPDFGRDIFFPEVVAVPCGTLKPFLSLLPSIQDEINAIKEKDCVTLLNLEEKELLWSKRRHLFDIPELLPKVLQSAHTWNWASLSDIYMLLKYWKPPTAHIALQLLMPQFADTRVRMFAVQRLEKMDVDDIIDFLPQLVQSLKFESFHNCAVAEFLLSQACISPAFAIYLFWLLKEAAVDVIHRRRYHLMFGALMSVSGLALRREFQKQEELVRLIGVMAEKVKLAKDKDVCLSHELGVMYEFFEDKSSILLPLSPGMEVTGVDAKSSSYFNSNAFPLKLVFNNSCFKAEPIYTMFKVGDDLRQDMLTLQFVAIMDKLWRKEGLNLQMITYHVLSTAPKRGMVELVTESETLRKIQGSHGLTGSFKEQPIKLWLQKHNTTELDYERAVNNFTRSCAGYCVATYVLGICDRHNDNIMVKQSGHMFHIDFGKFLGDSQMFGSFKRDRVPFVLTSDMAYVINDGGRQNDRFQQFVELCCKAFNILRKHSNLFLSLFMLMSKGGIPGVTEASTVYVQKALLPDKTNAQAIAIFSRMIDESLKCMFTQFNFFLHNLAQMKFSSHDEGQLLSFVPKTYSIHTDNRILGVQVTDCQKRYTPEKHYVYVIKIERQGQRLPSFIFRRYSEFVEFREKLVSMYPLTSWPEFVNRVIIGRSQIKSVAEVRKSDVENFLCSLLEKAPEISECDHVYTFFHPLLRDEQDDDAVITQGLKETSSTMEGANAIKGQVKVSVEYKKGTLNVMIMHAKDLGYGMHEAPNAYVKTYLLPDPFKQTKRRTKVSRSNTHPIYNEILQYKMVHEDIMEKTLQVTVWNSDLLKGNQFLGAVYLRLRQLDLAIETINWYTLGNLQMSTNEMLI